MKIASAQVESKVGDIEGNFKKHFILLALTKVMLVLF